MHHAVKHRVSHITFVFEHLINPSNIAACLRSCDGFGVFNVHVIATTPRRSLRYPNVSRGAERWINVTTYTNSTHCIETLKKHNFKILVSDLGADSHKFEEIERLYSPSDRLAFVFGNENTGVSKEMKDAAELRWHIPMLGFVHSFNVSAAVAIVLAYLFKSKFIGQTNLTEEEQMELLLRYLIREAGYPKQFLERNGITLAPHFFTPL